MLTKSLATFGIRAGGGEVAPASAVTVPQRAPVPHSLDELRSPDVPLVPIIALQNCRRMGNVRSPRPHAAARPLDLDTQVDQGLLHTSDRHRRLRIDEDLVIRAAELSGPS